MVDIILPLIWTTGKGARRNLSASTGQNSQLLPTVNLGLDSSKAAYTNPVFLNIGNLEIWELQQFTIQHVPVLTSSISLVSTVIQQQYVEKKISHLS